MLMQTLDKEISLSKKGKKPFHLNLTKVDGVYKAHLPFKMEGDYILNSSSVKDKAVMLQYINGQVELELDSEENDISAFLTKDDSSILRAVKAVMKNDCLIHEPSFIVGPPGTGKTKVITKIVSEAIDKNLRVLVLSPTNKAVENVFERIDLDTFEIGDVVASITTDIEDIQKLSPKNLKAIKLQPIEDEIEILQETKIEFLEKIRDFQPNFMSLQAQQESIKTLLSNAKRDKDIKVQALRNVKNELSSLELRLSVLTGNSLLKAIASTIMTKKLSQLNKDKATLEEEKMEIENEISTLDSKIQTIESSNTSMLENLKSSNIEHEELKKTIKTINEQLVELQKQKAELMQNDIFASAKIGGATLVGAALNQKIQNGNFDMVIVDEVSMAIVPLLVTASQTLNKNKFKFDYLDDDSLYSAQNEAVAMALNTKFVLVGDPKQLQPIAQTHEMKQSVFSLYGVEDIFKGSSVKNTVLLDINFRNHPQITKLASELFYGGLLKSGKEKTNTRSLFLRRSASKMVFSNGSYINYGNMKIVVSQVSKALDRGRRSIGIITPYKKQASLIDDNLSELKKQYPDADIQTGTIHVFQGKEAEIIIYDLTFSPSENNDYIPAAYNGDINSDTAKLLNVAMTRAEDFFIVVGDASGISKLQNSLVLKEWICKIDEVNQRK